MIETRRHWCGPCSLGGAAGNLHQRLRSDSSTSRSRRARVAPAKRALIAVLIVVVVGGGAVSCGDTIASLSVPVSDIERPLEDVTFIPVTSVADLQYLLGGAADDGARSLVAFAPYRSSADFESTGITNTELVVRLRRMSKDSHEVNQAVAITADNQIVRRYVITSIPTTLQTGVCVVTAGMRR